MEKDYILCGILPINGLRGRFSCQTCWCQTGTVKAEDEISLIKAWRTDSSISEVKYKSSLPTNGNQASSFTMRDNAIFLIHIANFPTVKPQRQHLCIQGMRNHNTFLRCLSAQTKAVLIQKVEWVWWRGLDMQGPAEESVGASEEERGQCAEHREGDEDRTGAAVAAIEGEGQ